MNKIICGDAIEEIKKLPENSVDAIITDPPYGLEFMGKEWDKFGISPGRAKRLTQTEPKTGDPKYDYLVGKGRYSEMDLKEKTAMQNFMYSWAKECLRVLKPGGYLLSFGGTRTYHRMTCGIEDAGFEIRDTIMWLYGSGFPKSLDIGQDFDRQECRKQLEKKLGRKPTRDEFKKSWKNFRKVIGIKQHAKRDFKDNLYAQDPANRNNEKVFGYGEEELTFSVTLEAKEWEGWGTALKPAVEPIVVARKPLSKKNVALNVLKWGTGGINIDESRIGNELVESGRKNRQPQKDWGMKPHYVPNKKNKVYGEGMGGSKWNNTQGRFPANIILDEESANLLDEQSGNSKSQGGKNPINVDSKFGQVSNKDQFPFDYGDKGGASHFFYVAKASKSERNFGLDNLPDKTTDDGREVVSDRPHQRGASQRKNNHPTVKPIKLMEYLIKLVSREGATILDPFIGSGTTAIASLKTNRMFIGIEKEEEYVKIAQARIKPFLEQTKLK